MVLDSKPFDTGYRIASPDEAENWILEQVSDLETVRARCNVGLTDISTQAADQKRMFSEFMIKYGVALGSLVALHRTGKIGDVCYNDLRSRVLGTLVPTLITG